ncbi:MAG: DUF4139 domain-containing protein [Planctomycetota bacterium]
MKAICRTLLGLAAVLLGAQAYAAAGAAPPPSEGAASAGKVEAVTLYQDQALVTRTVPLDGPGGAREVVVGSLPDRVVPESLFAEAGENVFVRAVRFRSRAVGEEPREEVRKIDQELEAIEEKSERNQRMQALVSERLAYLGKLENFVAPTVSVEMAKGVLNADALKAVTLFNFDQRRLAADESLALAKEAKALAKQAALLQQKRAELTGRVTKTVREAVLFVDKKIAGPASVRLSYLVADAGWSPAYNFRATTGGKEIRIEYNAQIRQQSGEDWDGVALTLSTAFPMLSAEAPGLAPFRVALVPAGSGGAPQRDRDIREAIGQIEQGKTGNRYFVVSSDGVIRFDANWQMNVAANAYQGVELDNPKSTIQIVAEAAKEGPSVQYRIAAPVSLASRADQQLIRISEAAAPAALFHVASPILAPYVYRQAEIVNSVEDALLGGPVNAYLDGRFVGRVDIPTVARGEKFFVGFGADGQVRAKRELVERKENVQGGNREISFQYRLVVENFKAAPVSVRLKDRIPVSDRETEIRVTLGEMNEKTSGNALYLRVERPKGILRWDVDVKANASGEQAKMVLYSYRVEFDRNFRLAEPGSGEEDGDKNLKERRSPSKKAGGRREFEEMQKSQSIE